jgi:hypothetical protein
MMSVSSQDALLIAVLVTFGSGCTDEVGAAPSQGLRQVPSSVPGHYEYELPLGAKLEAELEIGSTRWVYDGQQPFPYDSRRDTNEAWVVDDVPLADEDRRFETAFVDSLGRRWVHAGLDEDRLAEVNAASLELELRGRPEVPQPALPTRGVESGVPNVGNLQGWQHA